MDLFELEAAPVDWEDRSYLKSMTCINHQGMRYLSKNPWDRSTHIIKVDPALPAGKEDCGCPFADMRVVAEGGK